MWAYIHGTGRMDLCYELKQIFINTWTTDRKYIMNILFERLCERDENRSDSESQQKKKRKKRVYNGAAAVGRDLSGDLDRVCQCELICSAATMNRRLLKKFCRAISYIYTLSRDIIFFSFCWNISGYYTMSLIYLDYPCTQKLYGKCT